MELQVLYSVFCSPAACPLLRASIRASAKRPGFGPRDPVRDRLTPDAIAAMYRAPEFPSSKDLAADAELTVLLQSLLPQEGSLVPVLAAVYMGTSIPRGALSKPRMNRSRFTTRFSSASCAMQGSSASPCSTGRPLTPVGFLCSTSKPNVIIGSQARCSRYRILCTISIFPMT
jgi:hypothetical protein